MMMSSFLYTISSGPTFSSTFWPSFCGPHDPYSQHCLSTPLLSSSAPPLSSTPPSLLLLPSSRHNTLSQFSPASLPNITPSIVTWNQIERLATEETSPGYLPPWLLYLPVSPCLQHASFLLFSAFFIICTLSHLLILPKPQHAHSSPASPSSSSGPSSSPSVPGPSSSSSASRPSAPSAPASRSSRPPGSDVQGAPDTADTAGAETHWKAGPGYWLYLFLSLLLSVSWALLILSALLFTLVNPADSKQHGAYPHVLAYAAGQVVTWLLALRVLLLYGKRKDQRLVGSARVWLFANAGAVLLLSAGVVLRFGSPGGLKAESGGAVGEGVLAGNSRGNFGVWSDFLTLVTLPVALLFGAFAVNGRPGWALPRAESQPSDVETIEDGLRTPLLIGGGAIRESHVAGKEKKQHRKSNLSRPTGKESGAEAGQGDKRSRSQLEQLQDEEEEEEQEQKKQQEEPPMTLYASADWLSALTFGWVSPFLEAGAEKTVAVEDVPSLQACDRAEANFRAFDASWARQVAEAEAAEAAAARGGGVGLIPFFSGPFSLSQACSCENLCTALYRCISVLSSCLHSLKSFLTSLYTSPYTQQEDSKDSATAEKTKEDKEEEGEQTQPKATVTRALWECFWRPLVLTGVLALGKTGVMYAGPLLLASFVQFAAGERAFPGEGVVLVVALFLSKASEIVLEHQFNFRSEVLGLDIKAALVGALYRKGLRLSSKAKQRHTIGEIVNYMSTDAQRLADLMWELHNIWVLPLQIVCALVILFHVVGISMLSGLGVMLAVMLANLLVASGIHRFITEIMSAKDARMKATSEALSSMKIIKLYAWQQHFQDKIQSLRDSEASWLVKFMAYAAVNIFLLWLTPLAVSVATFGTMVALGVPLTPASVFTAIATFRILQEPLRSFPSVISAVTQAMVSLKRLSRFLSDEELQWDAVERVGEGGGMGGEGMRDGLNGNGYGGNGGISQQQQDGEGEERGVEKGNEEPVEGKRKKEGDDDVVVRIENGTFSWDADPEKTTLTGVDLEIRRGMRVAVCGTVGAGKSSLLSCILGEVPKLQGKVFVSGPTAYVPQSAWIQNATIRDNILFGQPLDRARYHHTLHQCSLLADLRLFPLGADTQIGERGVNLSGGQKQRIQLARAMYAGVGMGAEVYLLDDPFSAVDAHTGSELFMEYVLKGLAGKTVILVTHQVEFLPAADLILVMKEGRIVQSGRYDQLLAEGTDFSALVEAHTDALESQPVDPIHSNPHLSQLRKQSAPNLRKGSEPNLLRKASHSQLRKMSDPMLLHTASPESHQILENMEVGESDGAAAGATGSAGGAGGSLGGAAGEDGDGQLISKEERESGRVSLAVYWQYMTKAMGGWHVPLLLLVQLAWQALQIGSDLWLATYSSAGAENSSAEAGYTSAGAGFNKSILSNLTSPLSSPLASSLSSSSFTPSFSSSLSSSFSSPLSFLTPSAITPSAFMKLYSLLALGSGLFVLLRTAVISWAGVMTTQAFFRSMQQTVFRAPMSFFDSTPIGRILSRASTDQSALDLDLPFQFGSLLAMVFQLLGILFVTSYITWPVFYAIIPLTYLYFSFQEYYLMTSRELSRLNGVTKAPIIEHFSESLSGAAVIRAFAQQPRFAHKSAERVDTNNRVAFHYGACTVWLGVHLELLGALLLCFSAFMLVWLPPSVISPGLAGMSLSYGLALSQGLFYVVWVWCALENQMVSVERILQFSHPNVPPEAPLSIPSHRPPSSWPDRGAITFENLQIRYRPDLPLVLKGVSLQINGGEKVGVVGRTGSGKSTLVVALFRLVEPTAGRVVIDGVDTTRIGLTDLRSRLAIIPQDPTLFQGSVRMNVDPAGEYRDEEIWEALDRCQLGEVVRGMEEKLEAQVVEGGENWSVGQRQLFCLGRALLKRTRILVLDEATASVDSATDAVIQRTIKECFGDATIISIAHRIATVIDSNKVVVMDQGKWPPRVREGDAEGEGGVEASWELLPLSPSGSDSEHSDTERLEDEETKQLKGVDTEQSENKDAERLEHGLRVLVSDGIEISGDVCALCDSVVADVDSPPADGDSLLFDVESPPADVEFLPTDVGSHPVDVERPYVPETTSDDGHLTHQQPADQTAELTAELTADRQQQVAKETAGEGPVAAPVACPDAVDAASHAANEGGDGTEGILSEGGKDDKSEGSEIPQEQEKMKSVLLLVEADLSSASASGAATASSNDQAKLAQRLAGALLHSAGATPPSPAGTDASPPGATSPAPLPLRPAVGEGSLGVLPAVGELSSSLLVVPFAPAAADFLLADILASGLEPLPAATADVDNLKTSSQSADATLAAGVTSSSSFNPVPPVHVSVAVLVLSATDLNEVRLLLCEREEKRCEKEEGKEVGPDSTAAAAAAAALVKQLREQHPRRSAHCSP
ncbi:unnamed protein product [Closterium sp. NIES-64]|nr:unnamed protein product [Closterium sp. NIES-64]